jgi:hypothetical protein
MKNKNMNIVERALAPTPKWFKILRSVGIALASVGGVIIESQGFRLCYYRYRWLALPGISRVVLLALCLYVHQTAHVGGSHSLRPR